MNDSAIPAYNPENPIPKPTGGLDFTPARPRTIVRQPPAALRIELAAGEPRLEIDTAPPAARPRDPATDDDARLLEI